VDLRPRHCRFAPADISFPSAVSDQALASVEIVGAGLPWIIAAATRDAAPQALEAGPK